MKNCVSAESDVFYNVNAFANEKQHRAKVSPAADRVACTAYFGLRTVLCPQCGKPVDLDRNGQIYPHNETQSVQPRPQKV